MKGCVIMICRVLGVSRVFDTKDKKGQFLKVSVSYQSTESGYVGEDVMSLMVFDNLKCFERFAVNPQSCKNQIVTVDFVPGYGGRANLQDIIFSKAI